MLFAHYADMRVYKPLLMTAIVLLILSVSVSKVAGDVQSVLPDPFILAHGGFEDGYFDFLLNEEGKTPVPNVVVVRCKYGGLASVAIDAMKKLKGKGVLLARQVMRTPYKSDKSEIVKAWQDSGCAAAGGPNYQNKIPKCAYINAQNWKDKLSDDLGGDLPGGFKALAIDEIPLLSNFPGEPEPHKSNLEFDIKIAVETLKMAKTHAAFKDFFKDKFIFVWAGGDPEADVLETMLTYADRILIERYLKEGADTKSFSDDINKIIQVCETEIKGPICGKITEKSIMAIGTASTEDEAEDNNPEIDFPEYLDEELHYIKNDAVLRKLPGIGFYTFNRASGETITWINKLARHYYINGQIGYYSSDDFNLGYVKNPSFEEQDNAWTIQSVKNGEASVKDITAIDPKLIDEYWTTRRRIPHGHKVLDEAQSKLVDVYNVLYMKRGSSQNTATQEVVLPKGFYRLDVYAKMFSPNYEEAHGDVRIAGPNGSSLITYKEKRKINIKSVTVDAADPKYYLWTRFRIEFKTPEDNFPVKIILSDNQAGIGEITLWDFVELEKIKSGSLTAGIVSFNIKFPAESLNLIGNSGFEYGLENWWTWVPDGANAAVSDTAYEGKSGVKIQTNGGVSRGAIFKTGSQAIPVTPGEKYTFSAWVKTGSVGFAQLNARFFTSAYAWLNGANDPIKGEIIPPNQDWKKYDLTVTVPEKAVYMTPMLFAQGGQGYAYFDSARLEKIGNIVSLLKNRSFEDAADFWAGEGEIKDKPLEAGAKALLVQSSAGYNSFGQDIFLQQTFSYKISGWVYLDNFKEGDSASIHVRAYTNSGQCKDFIVQADNVAQDKWQYIEAAAKINWSYQNNAELLLSAYRPQSDGGASPPLAAYFDNINVEALDNNYAGAFVEPVECPSQIEKETEPTDQGQVDQEQVAQESTVTGSTALDEPDVQELAVQTPLGGQSNEVVSHDGDQAPPKVEVISEPEIPAAPEEAPVGNGGGGGGCSLVR
jgi:hypothetical protein